MLLDLLQYVRVLLLQGRLGLQVLLAVLFIAVFEVTEDVFFPNPIVAKVHSLSLVCIALLTIHVGVPCQIPLGAFCLRHSNAWTLFPTALAPLLRI